MNPVPTRLKEKVENPVIAGLTNPVITGLRVNPGNPNVAGLIFSVIKIKSPVCKGLSSCKKEKTSVLRCNRV